MKTQELKSWTGDNGKTIKIGDTVNVYVSPNTPRRRIKIEKINSHYKGDPTGGIEGITPQGSFAWARISQLHKFGGGLD